MDPFEMIDDPFTKVQNLKSQLQYHSSQMDRMKQIIENEQGFFETDEEFIKTIVNKFCIEANAFFATKIEVMKATREWLKMGKEDNSKEGI